MIYRIFVEAKPETNTSAANIAVELRDFLGIQNLENVRMINRYDVAGVSEEVFAAAVTNILAQPPLDDYFSELEIPANSTAFAVSYLPGQYDQRADSAAVCIQMLSQVDQPLVSYACVYLLTGDLSTEDIAAIKKYLINPVDSHEVSLAKPDSLALQTSQPQDVPIISGFTEYKTAELEKYLVDHACAMDLADLHLVQSYFQSLHRDPTETELKVIDTYWSDHCRHTTFNTALENIEIADPRVQSTYDAYLAIKSEINPERPVTLMNIATMAMKHLRRSGKLAQLDESDEINACTIKVTVDVDGQDEDWLLLFKNETHNHPTEIEPFGGAATCIGGAIRDPLSGRAYVYAAMRVTGAANPLTPLSQTLPGKLPQRKIVTTAADGYSSYGNQIGLATSFIDEIYDPSYAAKRLEIGGVLGAVKAAQIQRAKPLPGDLVVLVGGATGRDGIGGATGSSRAHKLESVAECGAQVQKGNAPEERKLQRLFRRPEVTQLVKKCNDFGAGGVCVAVGELAAGLDIRLDAVYKKYEGLNATELAVSESQERMALVIAAKDLPALGKYCGEENLRYAVVAEVTAEPVLKMSFRGQEVVRLERSFLDTNGAEKQNDVAVPDFSSFSAAEAESTTVPAANSWGQRLEAMMQELNHCAKEGLIQQFDASIGANTVLMPLGGKYQKTPTQAMVHKLPVLRGDTHTCSVMAYGFNPVLSRIDPYRGAYEAVVDSVAKVIAVGGDLAQVHLSFQEYFPSLGQDKAKWGMPFAALMGAFQAQLDLGMAAIGGKDSMSGTFEDLEVIPTLVSFAVSLTKLEAVISPELKSAGEKVVLIKPSAGKDPLRSYFQEVVEFFATKNVRSAYSLTNTPLFAAAFKMALGNRLGIEFTSDFMPEMGFSNICGGFLVSVPAEVAITELAGNEWLEAIEIGTVITQYELRANGESVQIDQIQQGYEAKLEPVYPVHATENHIAAEDHIYPVIENGGAVNKYRGPQISRPRVLIPVFPGTNCEYDTQRAWEKAGAQTQIIVIKNLSVADIEQSIDDFAAALAQSQILFLPGGFSGGDEPDGSAKFITSFLRNAKVATEIDRLLNERNGLIGGICNGFQALIKLGMLPGGKIMEPNANMPTLAHNTIGRHQSSIVNVRVCNNTSPWLQKVPLGAVYQVPISHGEGRIVGDVPEKNIATQYVDRNGTPTSNIAVNPNNSYLAIEGIISDCGRVFGKMGHSERFSQGTYQNVPGEYDMQIFASAVAYFQNPENASARSC
ncbi:phosphoribosylformylglycinamidine synthase [Arcanobacterium hippocoleae]|uniref:Phosphoribosylformylglycinamidine synthase n=1 Tax=Arcanobacterium hippocoleae TaxID=149017 RepID=A0ABU1T0M1_9ACTO|nr:phosphoribosylformylglycinamidine synthase [Arcanobacterium hippocoleae]MDR6938839.1 phosphoribosylformylglycinamidine synthase [Arcanobacterium hippocoleae]